MSTCKFHDWFVTNISPKVFLGDARASDDTRLPEWVIGGVEFLDSRACENCDFF
jgi:hypothetical protein